jgi:hypothetical protein
MRALRELSERIGDYVMSLPLSVNNVYEIHEYVEQEFAKFKEEWPGDYEMSGYFEGEHKFVVGVKFKRIEDKHWADLRWS